MGTETAARVRRTQVPTQPGIVHLQKPQGPRTALCLPGAEWRSHLAVPDLTGWGPQLALGGICSSLALLGAYVAHGAERSIARRVFPALLSPSYWAEGHVLTGSLASSSPMPQPHPYLQEDRFRECLGHSREWSKQGPNPCRRCDGDHVCVCQEGREQIVKNH